MATTFPAPASSLRLLLLGAGGREHALAWKLAQSKRVEKVFVSPGNGGTDEQGAGKIVNVTDLKDGWGSDFGHLVQWAQANKVCLRLRRARRSLLGRLIP